MTDVFISYAREDLEKVRPFVGAIEGAGYDVFWDRKTPAGMTWRQYIGKALDEARCVVVVWSTSSKGSDWVIEEADDGRQRGILIPITIEDVTPPLGFRALQHEDLGTWDGDPEQPPIQRLLASIERVTGKPQPHKQDLPPKENGTAISPAESPPLVKPAKTRKSIQARKPGFFAKPGAILVALAFIAAIATALYLGLVDQRRQASNAVLKSYTNRIGMQFAFVPAGTFMMGSQQFEYEQPVHQVFIRKPFYMQTTEVTQKQWMEVMGENPSSFIDCGQNCPVEHVNWHEVQTFIRKLNELTGKQYRLPTEAEWEFAANSGGKNQTYAGGENIGGLGWYRENSDGRTHPVGQKKPNGLGFYDMSGNVWEWVEDDWHGDYAGAPNDDRAWVGDPRGPYRVIRGGSWFNDARYCRSAARSRDDPGNRNFILGFRLCRSVTPGP